MGVVLEDHWVVVELALELPLRLCHRRPAVLLSRQPSCRICCCCRSESEVQCFMWQSAIDTIGLKSTAKALPSRRHDRGQLLYFHALLLFTI